LKAHLKNQAKFDPVTLRAPKDDPEVGGDYYGLPWPCWGTPELRHPGTPILYNTNLHVMEGGGAFRARFGVERDVTLPDGTARKDNLLAEGSYTVGSEIKDGYPEFTYAVLKKLGWDKDLKPEELALIQNIGGNNPDAISWSTDLSGGIQRVALAHGCVPYGNAKARANAWNLPDPIPVHREPIYTPRAELVAKYPTRPNERQFRLPNLGFDVQKAAVEKGIAKQFPLILTPVASWSTRAAGRSHGPTNGSPNCSSTCSSRSILLMRPSAASRIATGSACGVRRCQAARGAA
jgi:formate dehydrogenase major subunit